MIVSHISHPSSNFNLPKRNVSLSSASPLPPPPLSLPPRRSQKVVVSIYHIVIPAGGMKKFQDFAPTNTTNLVEQGLQSVNGVSMLHCVMAFETCGGRGGWGPLSVFIPESAN